MARSLKDILRNGPKVDLERIKNTSEADIRQHMIEDGQDPDAPVTGFVLKRAPGQRGPGKKQPKVHVSFRLDQEIVDTYRATGPGWQKRAQEALARGARLLESGPDLLTGRRDGSTGGSNVRQPSGATQVSKKGSDLKAAAKGKVTGNKALEGARSRLRSGKLA